MMVMWYSMSSSICVYLVVAQSEHVTVVGCVDDIDTQSYNKKIKKLNKIFKLCALVIMEKSRVKYHLSIAPTTTSAN